MNAHDVGEAVTRHVGQTNAAGRIVEVHVGKCVLVSNPFDGRSFGESVIAEVLIPGKAIVARQQQIRQPVAGQVDAAQVRIRRINRRLR